MRAVTNWESYSFEASPLCTAFSTPSLHGKIVTAEHQVALAIRAFSLPVRAETVHALRPCPLPLGVHSNFKWAGRDWPREQSAMSGSGLPHRCGCWHLHRSCSVRALTTETCLSRYTARPYRPAAAHICARPSAAILVGKMSGRAQPWITAEYLAGRPAKIINPVAVPVVDVAGGSAVIFRWTITSW